MIESKCDQGMYREMDLNRLVNYGIYLADEVTGLFG